MIKRIPSGEIEGEVCLVSPLVRRNLGISTYGVVREKEGLLGILLQSPFPLEFTDSRSGGEESVFLVGAKRPGGDNRRPNDYRVFTLLPVKLTGPSREPRINKFRGLPLRSSTQDSGTLRSGSRNDELYPTPTPG